MPITTNPELIGQRFVKWDAGWRTIYLSRFDNGQISIDVTANAPDGSIGHRVSMPREVAEQVWRQLGGLLNPSWEFEQRKTAETATV